MENLIDIDLTSSLTAAAEQQLEGIDIEIEQPKTRAVMSTDAAKTLGYNYKQGLSDRDISEDELAEVFVGPFPDQEEMLRDRLASMDDLENAKLRSSMVGEYLWRNRGKETSQVDVDYIQQLSKYGIVDRTLFFEKRLSDTVLNSVFTVLPEAEEPLENAVTVAGDLPFAEMDAVSGVMAKQQNINRLMMQLQNEWDSKSYLGIAADVVESAIPLLSQYRKRNLVAEGPVSSLLAGDNLEEQAKNYYSLSEKEVKEFNDRLMELAKTNIFDAYSLLGALNEYSRTEKIMDNLITALDVTGVGLAVATPVQTVRGILGSTLKATSAVGKLVPHRIASAVTPSVAGDYLRATAEFAAQGRVGRPSATILDDLKDSVGILDVGSISGAQQVGNASQNAFLAKMQQMATQALRAVTDSVGINRITPGTEAFNEMLRVATNLVHEELKHIRHTAINVRAVSPDEKAITSNNYLEVLIGDTGDWSLTRPGPTAAQNTVIKPGKDIIEVTLGDTGYRAFPSKEMAEAVAKDFYNITDFEAVQIGSGWFLKQYRGVPETASSIKEALLVKTGNTKGSFYKAFLGALRGSNKKMTEDSMNALLTATYGSDNFIQFIRDSAKSIGTLGKKSRNDLINFVETQRGSIDPVTKAMGTHSKTLDNFISDWNAQFGRVPTEKEATAYFSMRQIHDFEWLTNNLNAYRDKVVQGLRHWEVDEISGIEAALIRPEEFFDRMVKNPPETNPRVYWFDRPGGQNERLTLTNMTRRSTYTSIRNAVEREGYIILNVSDDGQRVLRDAGFDGHIDYILVKSNRAKSSSLPYQQIPHADGWHVGYDASFYISRPEMTFDAASNVGSGRFARYYGDKNHYGFNARSMGRKYEERLNTARRMLAEAYDRRLVVEAGLPQGTSLRSALRGDAEYTRLRTAFVNYVNTNLPEDVRTFEKNFRVGRRLNRDQMEVPFVLREANKDSLSVNLPNFFRDRTFVDMRNSIHNPYSRAVNLRYAQERNLPINTIAERSGGRPSKAPVDFVNVHTMVNNAARTVLKGRYFDDVKTRLAYEFIETFKDVLDVSEVPLDQMRRNAVHTLMNARFNPKGDAGTIAQAKVMRRTIMEVVGQKTELQKKMDAVKSQLANSIYDNLGPNGLAATEKVIQIADGITLGAVKDPVQAMRSVAFHSTMGFFNPVQLVLQAQTAIHTTALLGPVKAAGAIRDGSLMFKLRLMNQIAGRRVIGKISQKLGSNPQHVEEMYEWFTKSGADRIGRSYSLIDQVFDEPVITTTWQNFLHKGTFPFRGGEEYARSVAWAGAYNEWRVANPTARMTDQVAQTLVGRMEQLTNRMSSASQASWQRGPLSTVTQFWGYQARLMEAFLGKELTWMEKFRALSIYGVMYGLPIGVGGTTLGAIWPVHESIRAWLEEYRIPYRDDMIGRVLMDGVGELVGNFVFGVDNNFSARLGPGGNPVLRDILKGEKSLWDLGMGVSGSIGLNWLKTTTPIGWALMNGRAPTEAAILDFISNVRTLNQGRRAYNAAILGEYIEKNGKTMQYGLGVTDALTLLTTGTSPNGVQDAYVKMDVRREITKQKKANEQDAIKNIRLMYKAFEQNNFEEAKKHQDLVNLLLAGHTPTEKSAIFSRAHTPYLDGIQEEDRRLMNASPEMRQRFYDAFEAKQNKQKAQ